MTDILHPISDADRRHILQHTARIWPSLAGSHFFITGGTGFFGKWLLEALMVANDFLGTNIRATLLTRSPSRFVANVPHLANRREFSLIQGDSVSQVRRTDRYDFLVDFATPSAAEVGVGGTAVFDRCLKESTDLIAFAGRNGVRRVLYASSGAIYGPQPADIDFIPEEFVPEISVLSPYGLLKRRTEALWLESGIDCVIARGFAFIGPYLPLTDKFAAGSFLRDALAGGPVALKGDGKATRSYLYGAELAQWLVTLLAIGPPHAAYNIGSDAPTTILELANLIAQAIDGKNVAALEAHSRFESSRYVPCVAKAQRELELVPRIGLADAVARTLGWARREGAHPA